MTAIVVTTLPSTMTRLGYLLLFGVGSTAGMAALSGLLGWPLARLGAHLMFARTVSLVVGCVSTALGLVWGYPIIEDFSQPPSKGRPPVGKYFSRGTAQHNFQPRRNSHE